MPPTPGRLQVMLFLCVGVVVGCLVFVRVRVVDEDIVGAAFFVLVAVSVLVVVLCFCSCRRICVEGVLRERAVLRGPFCFRRLLCKFIGFN